MKGKVFQVSIGDDYTFDVEITYFYHQKPMGVRADNDCDCYGYTEMDWELLCGVLFDEDGEAVELSLSDAQDIAEKLHLEIEEQILGQIEDMSDDYY